MNIITGHYIINFYGLNGIKLSSMQAQARNLESAKQEAQMTITNNIHKPARPIHYTIDRRIVNSTDKDL